VDNLIETELQSPAVPSSFVAPDLVLHQGLRLAAQIEEDRADKLLG
jgi:hypothetical protein